MTTKKPIKASVFLIKFKNSGLTDCIGKKNYFLSEAMSMTKR